jgi:hypothetical protein
MEASLIEVPHLTTKAEMVDVEGEVVPGARVDVTE